MKIPIIILNWNGWDDTFACLKSLSKVSDNSIVWLVDNGSSEDRTQEALAILPHLRILKWDANYGWAGGYNRALEVALIENYEFAYLLNNDCKVTPDFLSVIIDAISENKDVAAVGSLITYAQFPGFLKFDGEYHPPGEQPLRPMRGLRPAREVNGAGMMVRLSAIYKEGNFDERFFCYAEETEWCRRVTKNGWSIVVCDESVISHEGEASNVDSNSRYYRIRNQFLLIAQLTPKRTRRLELLKHIYRCIRASNTERYLGRVTESQAILFGLRDGLQSRFGKRVKRPLGIFQVLAYCWLLPEGIGDKMRQAFFRSSKE